jgi:SAM-dependent methyltransferase
MDAAEVFWTLHADLPREGPGSDSTTRALLALAGPLPERARAVDIGCGPGRATLVLAEHGLQVTAVDTHEPFLVRLQETAARRGLADRVHVAQLSMTDLPFPDGTFDLVWSEGAAYLMGVDAALRRWRPLLAPGGALVFTEVGWTTSEPSPATRAFWAAYPGMRRPQETARAVQDAGYDLLGAHSLPESDWWDDYYGPLGDRITALTPTLTAQGGAAALAEARAEIDLRRDHPEDYAYTGFVLRRP